MHWFATRADQRFPASPLRFALVQGALRNIDLYGTLLDAVESGRGSVSLMLSRPLLDGAALLVWAGHQPEQDKQRTRLIRVMVADIQASQQRYPVAAVAPAFVDLVSEAGRLGLARVRQFGVCFGRS